MNIYLRDKLVIHKKERKKIPSVVAMAIFNSRSISNYVLDKQMYIHI